MLSFEAMQEILLGIQVAERELLLFTSFWFLVGAIDEFAVDLLWIWLKLTGRAHVSHISGDDAHAALRGPAAVFIPCWQEADVIGHTVAHALEAWRQDAFTLYVGCYSNDPDTVSAASKAAGCDPRVRIVIHECPGPTTKADCLNRLYQALQHDEDRYGRRFRCIVLHDSEDMVHPAELAVIDRGLDDADFVQLPVRPEPQPSSPWVAGHYSDEFTESHAKAMIVRDALGAAIPAAGVACGFSRDFISATAQRRVREGGAGPFASECLTEDYELGVLVWRDGGRSRFLRLRDQHGALVATRAFFPARLDDAVRQKARWMHGIAFQSWDRLGWSRGYMDLWMALRDRKGPLAAIVLACGYALIVLQGIIALAWLSGIREPLPLTPVLRMALGLCLASLLWRAMMRAAFTAHEYGIAEGLRALLRMPVANIIAIMAGRRAMVAYVATFLGFEAKWDKTSHDAHPAMVVTKAAGH
jgi:hypothetical protein